MQKNVAIILAGGTGKRLGLTKPKQFMKIAGKTVIEHTISIFESNSHIHEIAVVIHPMFYSEMEDIVAKNKWKKVKKILNGGSERFNSSLSAISAYENDHNSINLIFHDAVRPLVNSRIIDEVCDALNEYEAIDVVVPAVDTIVQADKHNQFIESIPKRNLLKYGQTPQAFHLNVIKKAYQLAMSDPQFEVSDDCGVVVKYLPEVKIKLVRGEYCNTKLTNPEDIYLLDKLFQLKSAAPSKISLEQIKNKVLVIFGGTSGIGLDMATIAKNNGATVFTFSRKVGNVNVSNYQQVQTALDFVFQKTGKIDYVVNTAAILNKEPILNLTYNDIEEIVKINYLGAVNTTLAAYPYLRQSHGQILQFTSSSYTRGRAYYAMYSSSKSAVVNFVQAIAEEWTPEGIRINCINPQRTLTPMRVQNFGIEDSSTLLKSEEVAKISLQTLLNDFTGEVVDIKLKL